MLKVGITMVKMGQLGCSPSEARARLRRLLDMGLTDLVSHNSALITRYEAKFINDMQESIDNNPDFTPTYGQVTLAEDLKEKYL